MYLSPVFEPGHKSTFHDLKCTAQLSDPVTNDQLLPYIDTSIGNDYTDLIEMDYYDACRKDGELHTNEYLLKWSRKK